MFPFKLLQKGGTFMNLFNYMFTTEKNRIKDIEKLRFYPTKRKDELNKELNRSLIFSYYLNNRTM